jgi:asparagine synthase (glutamine-hydrolysing)
MCGIAGIITQKKEANIKKSIDLMLNLLKHRGPDGHGSWINKQQNIAIGNTRLAIQDPTKRGNQPMSSCDGRYIIVFNGEIYNFRNIKRSLSDFNFKTNTDTEVLLYAYIKFGTRCLNKLEGFFSFVIWDNLKDELFCARDRFGIKPFYYTINQNKFIFSSEIKPILNEKKHYTPELNSINSYLTSEYYENIESTFYKNIFKLKPGHYIKFKDNKLHQKKFFDFLSYSQKKSYSSNSKQKKEMLENLIDNAVKKSLISDVPISIASSGGLDSSILQYHAKKNYTHKLKLISFDFLNKKYSEKKYVNNIQKITNLGASYSKMTPKVFLDMIRSSCKNQEEPFAGLPIISYEHCIKKRGNYKVILDGSGIDEAHCGYDKYFNNNKNYLKKAQDNTIIKSIISDDLKKNSNNNDYELKRFLKNDQKNQMYTDLFYIKLPRALRFRDKLSMAHSCELRPTFLDIDLITFLFNLKNEDQKHGKYGKYFLRETYEDILGKNIVFRNKQQVQTPQREWFSHEMKKWLMDFLENAEIWDTNWIDKKKFYFLFKRFLNGKEKNSFFIWKVINLEFWKKTYFK